MTFTILSSPFTILDRLVQLVITQCLHYSPMVVAR